MRIEIPEFADWKEEAEFWDRTDTASLMQGMFREAVLSDSSPESRFRFLPVIPDAKPRECAENRNRLFRHASGL